MNATTCPVLFALRSAAAAVHAQDSEEMAVAWCHLMGCLDREDLLGERYRVERMMRGLERRMARAAARQEALVQARLG